MFPEKGQLLFPFACRREPEGCGEGQLKRELTKPSSNFVLNYIMGSVVSRVIVELSLGLCLKFQMAMEKQVSYSAGTPKEL